MSSNLLLEVLIMFGCLYFLDHCYLIILSSVFVMYIKTMTTDSALTNDTVFCWNDMRCVSLLTLTGFMITFTKLTLCING